MTNDANNDNRQTLPSFQLEVIGANTRIVNALQGFGRTRGDYFGTCSVKLDIAERYSKR